MCVCVCAKERIALYFGQVTAKAVKLIRQQRRGSAVLKANHTHTHTDVKEKNKATKLRCMWAEHVAERVTGTHPHPETNWCDVMHKRREREREKKHNMACSFPKSNIIPAYYPPLLSAALSRAHQFFTLPLSLTQSVAVTIAPVWATFVISFNICTTIQYHYQYHCFKEILTSLLPSAHSWCLLYASPSIFLPFSAIPARSAVNLSQQHVIHPLMYAICNNHRGRETHTCRRYICRGLIMTWRLNGKRQSMDSALFKNLSLHTHAQTHTHKQGSLDFCSSHYFR